MVQMCSIKRSKVVVIVEFSIVFFLWRRGKSEGGGCLIVAPSNSWIGNKGLYLYLEKKSQKIVLLGTLKIIQISYIYIITVN